MLMHPFIVMNQDDDVGVLITLVDNNFKTNEAGNTVTLMFQLLSPAGEM